MIAAAEPHTARRIHKLLVALVLGAVLGIAGGWQYSTRGWDPTSKKILEIYSEARVLRWLGIQPGGAINIMGHPVDERVLLERLNRSGQEPIFARAFHQSFIVGPAAGAAGLAMFFVWITLLMERKK